VTIVLQEMEHLMYNIYSLVDKETPKKYLNNSEEKNLVTFTSRRGN